MNIKIKDFVRSILQNTLYACCYISLSRTRPKRRCISYYKNGLVSSHQSVGRWLIFYLVCCKNTLTKVVSYQQPTCLCPKMEFVVGKISLSCELYSLS